jgi:hypothetical protein
MSSGVTFVSAYYTFENTPYFNAKPEELDPWPILDMVQTGIQLCLYIGENSVFESLFESWAQEHTNFRVMPYRLYYKDMFVYKSLKNDLKHSALPENRNLAKDTLEYMVYMHSRTEIMEDAISENPWDSTYFAWIDFNLPRLFSKKENSLNMLRSIASHSFPERGLFLAGCWPKEALPNVAANICWRFCGGFFLGDTKSLTGFAELCRDHLVEFLDTYNRLTWEVNYWAWLEYEKADDWTAKCAAKWYRGDHNDTILGVLNAISADTYTVSIAPHVEQIDLTYPYVPDYLPGSASYVEWTDPASGETHHLLNTRFVNYWMYPNGYYRFHDADMVIGNRNMVSELDAETLEIADYREMQGDKLFDVSGLQMEQTPSKKRHFSEGLEDIRLFVGGEGRLRFIATNVNYSPVHGRNRMIVGDYDVDTLTFRNCRVVVPPEKHGGTEKNWIPIVRDLEELFLYRWSPFELGKVNPETNQLEIVERYSVNAWMFGKLRGSTTFVPYSDPRYLVGVAHFSEEHGPRHYYHMMVLLEKATLKPAFFSNTFYFEKLTIEFCIGFTIQGDKYVFWVSRFDRDPIRIRIAMDKIPIENMCSI